MHHDAPINHPRALILFRRRLSFLVPLEHEYRWKVSAISSVQEHPFNPEWRHRWKLPADGASRRAGTGGEIANNSFVDLSLSRCVYALRYLWRTVALLCAGDGGDT